MFRKIPSSVWTILSIVVIALLMLLIYPEKQQQSTSLTIGTNYAITTSSENEGALVELGIQQGPLSSYTIASYLVPDQVDLLRRVLAAHQGESAIFYAEYHPRKGGPAQLVKVTILDGTGKETTVWKSP